jgi:hypothetical protein
MFTVAGDAVDYARAMLALIEHDPAAERCTPEVTEVAGAEWYGAQVSRDYDAQLADEADAYNEREVIEEAHAEALIVNELRAHGLTPGWEMSPLPAGFSSVQDVYEHEVMTVTAYMYDRAREGFKFTAGPLLRRRDGKLIRLPNREMCGAYDLQVGTDLYLLGRGPGAAHGVIYAWIDTVQAAKNWTGPRAQRAMRAALHNDDIATDPVVEPTKRAPSLLSYLHGDGSLGMRRTPRTSRTGAGA